MADNSDILRHLRERYYTAKAKSDELGNSTNVATHLKFHGVQGAKIYSAVSTLLYASISVSKTEELEKYVLKKGASLPVSVFDMQEWGPFLEMARQVRAESAGVAVAQSQAQSPGADRARSASHALMESQIRADVGAEYGGRLRAAEKAVVDAQALNRSLTTTIATTTPAIATASTFVPNGTSSGEMAALRAKVGMLEHDNGALRSSLVREQEELVRVRAESQSMPMAFDRTDGTSNNNNNNNNNNNAFAQSTSIVSASSMGAADVTNFNSLLKSNEDNYEKMLRMQEQQWKARADMDMDQLRRAREDMQNAQSRVLALESDLREAHQRDRDARTEHAAAVRQKEGDHARMVNLLERDAKRDIAAAASAAGGMGAAPAPVLAPLLSQQSGVSTAEVEFLRSRVQTLEGESKRAMRAEMDVTQLRTELVQVQAQTQAQTQANNGDVVSSAQLAAAEQRCVALSQEVDGLHAKCERSVAEVSVAQEATRAAAIVSLTELTAMHSQLGAATSSASGETKQLHEQVSSLREELAAKERDLTAALAEKEALVVATGSSGEEVRVLRDALHKKERELAVVSENIKVLVGTVETLKDEATGQQRVSSDEAEQAEAAAEALTETLGDVRRDLTKTAKKLDLERAAKESLQRSLGELNAVAAAPGTPVARGGKQLGRPGSAFGGPSAGAGAGQVAAQAAAALPTDVGEGLLNQLAEARTALTSEQKKAEVLRLKLDRAHESTVSQLTALRTELAVLKKTKRIESMTVMKGLVPKQGQGGYKHISMPPAMYKKRVVIVQSMIRRFIGASRVTRVRMVRDAAANGVLAAMPGTQQGKSGWYMADHKMYYFCREGNNFMLLVGPLSEDQYDASLLLLKESLTPDDATLDSSVSPLQSPEGVLSIATAATKSVRLAKSIALSRHSVIACRMQIDALVAEVASKDETIMVLRENMNDLRNRQPQQQMVQTMYPYAPTPGPEEKIETMQLVNQLEEALMSASQENQVLRAHVASMQAQLVAAEDYLFSARASVGVATTAADAARLAAAASSAMADAFKFQAASKGKGEEEEDSLSPRVGDTTASSRVKVGRLDMGAGGSLRLAFEASDYSLDASRTRRIVALQALARGFVDRARITALKSHVSRKSDGMLRALAGTSQGKDGWYQAPNGMVYYFVLQKNDWLMVCGPLTITEFVRLQNAGRACVKQHVKSQSGGSVGLIRAAGVSLSGLKDSLTLERARWIEDRVFLDAKTMQMNIAVPVRDMMESANDAAGDVATSSVEE